MLKPDSKTCRQPPVVWICADGGPGMGYGHWVRASRLGKKISAWARISYVTVDKNGSSVPLDEITETAPVYDQLMASRMLASVRPHCLITDMPRIETETHRFIGQCRRAGALVASIHDLGLGQFDSHLAVDPSATFVHPFAAERYLLGFFGGPQYAVLPDRFRLLHDAPKTYTDTARSLLITLGGGAAWRILDQLLPAVEQLSRVMRVTILPGLTFENRQWLTERCPASVECPSVPPSENLADLLHEADMAVVAGGITLYEAACVGTPTLVVSHNGFQQVTGVEFDRLGIAMNIGVAGRVSPEAFASAVSALAADPMKRSEMGKRGKKLVDGRGAERLDKLLQQLLLNPGSLFGPVAKKQ